MNLMCLVKSVLEEGVLCSLLSIMTPTADEKGS
jgi:hypothetical protein